MESRTGFVLCLSTSLVKTLLPLRLDGSLKRLATKCVVVALKHHPQMAELPEIVKKCKHPTFGFHQSISTSTSHRAIHTWLHTRIICRAVLLFDQILAGIGGDPIVFYITRLIITLFRLSSTLRLSWRLRMVLRILRQERLINLIKLPLKEQLY